MWCNFLRPVESRVYEEAKDKTKVGCCDMMRFIWDWRIFLGCWREKFGMIQWWFMIFFFFFNFPGKGLWIAQFLRERGRVMETWWNLFSSHASGWDTHRTRGGGNHRFTRLHRWWKSWRMRMMTTTSPTQPKWIWSSSRSLSVISGLFWVYAFFLYSRWESAVPHCCLESRASAIPCRRVACWIRFIPNGKAFKGLRRAHQTALLVCWRNLVEIYSWWVWAAADDPVALRFAS